MLFSHCSEPSIPLSHFRALGECRGGAGQLPSAAGRSLLELAHRSRSAAAHYRAIGGAKRPHPRGKQEQNRAGDRAEHLRDEVGGALRTILSVSTAVHRLSSDRRRIAAVAAACTGGT